jgi:hypothetical protein
MRNEKNVAGVRIVSSKATDARPYNMERVVNLQNVFTNGTRSERITSIKTYFHMTGEERLPSVARGVALTMLAGDRNWNESFHERCFTGVTINGISTDQLCATNYLANALMDSTDIKDYDNPFDAMYTVPQIITRGLIYDITDVIDPLLTAEPTLMVLKYGASFYVIQNAWKKVQELISNPDMHCAKDATSKHHDRLDVAKLIILIGAMLHSAQNRGY